jgi:hypothetical protein
MQLTDSNQLHILLNNLLPADRPLYVHRNMATMWQRQPEGLVVLNADIYANNMCQQLVLLITIKDRQQTALHSLSRIVNGGSSNQHIDLKCWYAGHANKKYRTSSEGTPSSLLHCVKILLNLWSTLLTQLLISRRACLAVLILSLLI